jgi:hypothetical protein
MTTFLMHVLFPDGTAPDFGDADEARGLWVRADAPTDYRGLLALGAMLFNRGDFKAVAGRVTEEVFWLFGLDGVSRFHELKARPADEASVAYADAGYYVMRGGFGAADPMLVFDCGQLGAAPAGHAHADALSFQLHSGRYPFLVDSGTFSYNIDYAWRNVFRGTRAHNTVVVDGQEQSVPRDRMAWDSVARSRPHRWVTTRWFDLADGEHDGYGRLPDPVTHRRAIVFLKPDIWIILDDVRGRQHHDLESFLHVRPDCHVAAGSDGEALLTSPDGDRLRVWVSAEGHQAVGVEAVQGDGEHRDAWFSPGYGTRVSSRALRIRHQFDGACRLVTCCSISEHAPPRVTQGPGVMSIHMKRDEGCDDTLFYRTDGVRTLDADGVRFDGTVLFHRHVTGRRPVVCGSGFQELTIDRQIHVSSTATIDSVVLENDRCEIALADAPSDPLHVRLREGVQLVVNGRLQPSSAADVWSSIVTAS